MEYLNLGTIVMGFLLILGFLNADAIFREPTISDSFEEHGDLADGEALPD